jgi:transposase
MKRTGGTLWRAYLLKESLREVFAGDLDPATVGQLLDRWCFRAQRCRIPEFVKAAGTIRKHRAGIDPAIDRGLSNGRTKASTPRSAAHPTRPRLPQRPTLCSRDARLRTRKTLELPYHTSRHPHSWQ